MAAPVIGFAFEPQFVVLPGSKVATPAKLL